MKQIRLKEARLKAEKTQNEVANANNLTQFTYSNYEKGKTDPDIETLIKLAKYFHTTIDSLVGYENNYLLDKSVLSEQCQKVIDKICKLSERQCELVDTYIIGMMTAEEEKQNIIKNFKGE